MSNEIFNEVKGKVEAYKTALDEVKGKVDAIEGEKLAKMAADLADSEKRLDELEAAKSRAPIYEKSAERFDEVKTALGLYAQNPNSDEAKSKLLSLKSMNTITGPAGGVTVPTILADAIQAAPFVPGVIRQHAEVLSLKNPNYTHLIEATGAGYEWVSQGGTRSATATPTFEAVQPVVGTLAAKAPVTNEMLEDSPINVGQFIINRLARAFIVAESEAFVAGAGVGTAGAANQPSGLLNGTALNTFKAGHATNITADVLLNMTNAISSFYADKAVFLMNRKTLTVIRQLKNSNGDYIIRDSVLAGAPSTLWGYPIVIDENMPDIVANSKPVIFGSLYDGFLVVDIHGMSFLEDPYTALGFVNYIARKRVGSTVKDKRALVALSMTV